MKNIIFYLFIFFYPLVSHANIDERKIDVYFANGIKTKEWKSSDIDLDLSVSFDSSDVRPLSLKIAPTPIELKEGTTLELKTSIVYDDGSEQTPKGGVEWKSSNVSIVTIDNNATATALKEGKTTLSASYKGLTSTPTDALVYLEIGGHRLPPEPDPVINNSTLLGIDSNGNGVRDDVERWIYVKYQNEHPIHIDIGMQAGRAYKKVLESPERAKEIHNYVDASLYCEFYYMNDAKYFHEPILVKEEIDNKYFRKSIYFNTEEREIIYFQYDKLLSGGSYTLPKSEERKALCDFNTSKYEE